MADEIREDSEGKEFTAETYFQYLTKSQDHWWEQFGSEEKCNWIFRGHADASWKLVPAAYRPDNSNPLMNRINYFLNLPPGDQESNWFDKTENEKSFLLFDAAQATMLCEFREIAYDCGLIGEAWTPHGEDLNDPRNITAQCQLGQSWIGNSALIMDEEKSNVVRKISELAQHYGLPTYLLDWTQSGLTAAYFATNFDQSVPSNSDIAVWALKTEVEYRSCHPNLSYALYSPETQKNINAHSQASKFLYAAGAGIRKYFLEYGKFPALEDCIELERGIELRKIVLKQAEVSKFKKILNREDLTRSRLMPGFESVAEDVKNKWLRK